MTLKKIFLVMTVLLLSSAAYSKTLNWKLAEVHPDGYPTVVAVQHFAEVVKDKTDGRINIQVYNNSVLGDEKAIIEQVQFGGIQLARVSLSPMTQFSSKLNVLMLPYLYDDTDHMFRVLDSPIGDEFLESMTRKNLLGLSWFDAGSRNFYNTSREIKTPEDMKGLKIRVQPSDIMIDLVRALGASPTPMGYSEVYSALQTGVIDGAENNWSSYQTTSHYEVAKYFTTDGHTRVPEMIIINYKAYQSVSAEDQKVLKEAAYEAALLERELWQKAESDAEAIVRESGSIITVIEDVEPFQEKVKPLYEKYGKGNEKLLERILAVE